VYISALIKYLDPYPLDICIVTEVPNNLLHTLIQVRVKKRVIEEKENRYSTRRKVKIILDEVPK